MPQVGFEPKIPGMQASQDSSYIRPLCYRDRRFYLSLIIFRKEYMNYELSCLYYTKLYSNARFN
jgi:hypothetical protein